MHWFYWKKWCTRQESNLWLLPSEGSALSSWATGAYRVAAIVCGGELTLWGRGVQGSVGVFYLLPRMYRFFVCRHRRHQFFYIHRTSVLFLAWWMTSAKKQLWFTWRQVSGCFLILQVHLCPALHQERGHFFVGIIELCLIYPTWNYNLFSEQQFFCNYDARYKIRAIN